MRDPCGDTRHHFNDKLISHKHSQEEEGKQAFLEGSYVFVTLHLLFHGVCMQSGPHAQKGLWSVSPLTSVECTQPHTSQLSVCGLPESSMAIG